MLQEVRWSLAVLIVKVSPELWLLGCAGGGSRAACLRLCRLSVFHHIMISMARCCDGGGVPLHVATIRWAEMEVRDITDENPAHLWSLLAAMEPVGVVLLFGGVAEVCRQFPLSSLYCCLWAKT